MTLEELVAFLETRKVARFKLPERLEILSAFPLTSVGKINKTALREQMAQKLQASSPIPASLAKDEEGPSTGGKTWASDAPSRF